MKFLYDWDFPGAEKEFLRALVLNPNSVDVSYYSDFLSAMGRPDEAIAEEIRIRQIEPSCGPMSINSSKTPPRTAKLSTLGSRPARYNHSFHFVPCDRFGGGPGAPQDSNNAFSVSCEPPKTSAATAHTALGNRMLDIRLHVLPCEAYHRDYRLLQLGGGHRRIIAPAIRATF